MRNTFVRAALIASCLQACGGMNTDADAGAPDGAVATDAAPADAPAPDATPSGQACPGWLTPPNVDATIAVPAGGGSVLLRTLARGTQNYACRAVPSATDGGVADGGAADGGGSDSGAVASGATMTYAWTLTGPTATLADCMGAQIGTHAASTGGPTLPMWQTTEGSTVVGRKLAAFNSPDPSAVPWLLLEMTTHTESGPMSRVRYIQRVNTTGGKAPATGCDAEHVNAEVRVNYTADYYFWGA